MDTKTVRAVCTNVWTVWHDVERCAEANFFTERDAADHCRALWANDRAVGREPKHSIGQSKLIAGILY